MTQELKEIEILATALGEELQQALGPLYSVFPNHKLPSEPDSIRWIYVDFNPGSHFLRIWTDMTYIGFRDIHFELINPNSITQLITVIKKTIREEFNGRDQN